MNRGDRHEPTFLDKAVMAELQQPEIVQKLPSRARFSVSVVLSIILALAVLGERLDSKANMPPPESFEEAKKAADLVGLVRIEVATEAEPAPVKTRVVEVFKGSSSLSTIPVAWPRRLHPKVGDTFYVFLKRTSDGTFVQVSPYWTIYRVTESPKREFRGRRIHHSDSYWELDADSAVRHSYARKTKVSKWPVEHVVGNGDSLWKLADRYYGDRTRWRRILEHNAWIKDQGQLQPGWKIVIPSINDYE